MGDADEPTYYTAQWTPTGTVLVRFEGDERRAAEEIKKTVTGSGPVFLMRTQTFAAIIADQASREMIVIKLSLALGLVALVMALTGIYGVVSFAVRQRTREIGVRMALGAEGSDVVALMMRKGIAAILIGLICGLTLAAAASRLLTQVPVVSGLVLDDGLAYGGVVLLFGLSAFAAMYVPARRAARVDPVQSLRQE
jgi:ABC-type antimicrobial peptide transport system permease subunit